VLSLLPHAMHMEATDEILRQADPYSAMGVDE
jgi:hypothetical protein